MKEELKVYKITRDQTEDETVYKVHLKSKDKNIKLAIKISENDWPSFKEEYDIQLRSRLIFELKNPQTKMSDYEGVEE
ncbi:MAG: hypothetical protein J7L47_03125 [Candidatus Odinarchaeota archaeon]|nr:hypothetical protein [Candidatus Odinarchaeota archaeon]